MKSSEYTRQQINNAAINAKSWNNANATGKAGATRNDIVSAIWSLTSAVFFVGEQLALMREGEPKE